MPKLIINEIGKKEERVHNCLEDEISIGRSDENQIMLVGSGVSREHAKIVRQDENYFVIDLESGNGTLLNGSPVSPSEKHLLRNNDLISIDEYNLRFSSIDEDLEQSYNEEITDTDILEIKLLKKVLRALDKETVPSFEVLNGVAEGKKFFLSDDINEIFIGRDPSCEMTINEFAISRKHAKVAKRWGGIVIRDMESKNGTFVNNRRIVEEFLHDGDRIAVGTIVLLFRNPQEINLAQFEQKISPKHTPQAKLKDIPQIEEKSQEVEPPQKEEIEPEKDFPQMEIEATPHREPAYPITPSKQSFLNRVTPVEIGMMGLAGLVLIFALITLVNLLFT